MPNGFEDATISCDAAMAKRIRVLRRLTIAALLVALAALGVTSIASWGDHIGFSSNRDFYFHVRHPVRATVLGVTMWAGFALALIAGIASAWLTLRHRNR